MKIKVFITGGYKIVSVNVFDDVKRIADKYNRWEYVLWDNQTKTKWQPNDNQKRRMNYENSSRRKNERVW